MNLHKNWHTYYNGTPTVYGKVLPRSKDIEGKKSTLLDSQDMYAEYSSEDINTSGDEEYQP